MPLHLMFTGSVAVKVQGLDGWYVL